MASVTRAYAVFCTVNVPNELINEILDRPTDLGKYLRVDWALIHDLDRKAFTIPKDRLAVGCATKSNIPSMNFDTLGAGLQGLTKKDLEAGVLDPAEFQVGENMVECRIFGILDERSLRDDTMLVVKYDSDFERDADGNITSDDDTDVWRWYQFRIRRKNAIKYFISIEGMQALDLEEDPSTSEGDGVLTMSIS